MYEKNYKVITLERQKENYESLISNQIQSNKTIHDLKNKMFLINDYMQQSDPKALALVRDMCDVVSKAQIINYTNISSVDVLINAKHAEMKSKGILFACKTILNEQIIINNLDLCVIIGNILDNAIEACEKVNEEKKNIELSINTRSGCLAIKSTNPTISKIIVRTLKNDKLLHGYGLSNIEDIVNKYDGNIIFSIENKIFTIVITLNTVHFHPKNG